MVEWLRWKTKLLGNAYKKEDLWQIFSSQIRTFGHGNICKYCNRPFLNDAEKKQLAEHLDFRVSRESIDRMDSEIIDAINSAVGPDDVLHHLGDFGFATYDVARRYRDRILCRNIFFTWGNHDRKEIASLFNGCSDQSTIKVNGQYIFKNHYPMMSWDGSYKGTWMLHGHVHGNSRKNPLMRAVYDTLLILDVGVDGVDGPGSHHTFRPWSIKEIEEWMATKTAAWRANRVC